MEILIENKKYEILVEETKNKKASARLNGEKILIKIPLKWPKKEKEVSFNKLLEKSTQLIKIGKWIPIKNEEINFYNGQKIKILEEEYIVLINEEDSKKILILGNKIISTTKNQKEIKKFIISRFLPKLIELINKENINFNSKIGKISIRENSRTWGSCSWNNNISISFKLLFMESEKLRYVIVHELAHTKQRNHSVKFWKLVEEIIPNYKQVRKSLRDSFPNQKDDSYEEPF